jgi:hypothetical protein
VTVQLALMGPLVKLFTPAPVAVPVQPLMLVVCQPVSGVAVQVVVLPLATVAGLQLSVPPLPAPGALAVTV